MVDEDREFGRAFGRKVFFEAIDFCNDLHKEFGIQTLREAPEGSISYLIKVGHEDMREITPSELVNTAKEGVMNRVVSLTGQRIGLMGPSITINRPSEIELIIEVIHLDDGKSH